MRSSDSGRGDHLEGCKVLQVLVQERLIQVWHIWPLSQLTHLCSELCRIKPAPTESKVFPIKKSLYLTCDAWGHSRSPQQEWQIRKGMLEQVQLHSKAQCDTQVSLPCCLGRTALQKTIQAGRQIPMLGWQVCAFLSTGHNTT